MRSWNHSSISKPKENSKICFITTKSDDVRVGYFKIFNNEYYFIDIFTWKDNSDIYWIYY